MKKCDTFGCPPKKHRHVVICGRCGKEIAEFEPSKIERQNEKLKTKLDHLERVLREQEKITEMWMRKYTEALAEVKKV